MSKTDIFYRSGEVMKPEPYEYKECGLPGIFLQNGYEKKERDGEVYVSIKDMEGLHRIIGEHLITNRKELAPSEIRFLRKTLELTQSALARLIGQSSQQVARWEKGTSAMPGPADRLLRAIFLVRTMDEDEQQELLELLANIDEMDEGHDQTVTLYHDHDAWSDRLAA